MPKAFSTEVGTGARNETASKKTSRLDLFRFVLGPMHARAWTVETDVESLERLREHNRNSALVFLPCHRSYVDPLVSPLFGDLADLPPALIQTADLDPLRDDGTRYADALRAVGVPVRLTNYLRVPHGFASFPGVVATGAQHRAELVGELRTHLYAAHVSPDLLGG